MNIIITGHQIELSNGLKKYISGKASTKLTHFTDRLHNINILLEKEKLTYRCKINITSDFGDFHSHALAEVDGHAVELALDKMVYEIKKKHDKLVDII
ncbi:MAG: HPF/RaiA family ribosome-associated protein [Brevinema sp.]